VCARLSDATIINHVSATPSQHAVEARLLAVCAALGVAGAAMLWLRNGSTAAGVAIASSIALSIALHAWLNRFAARRDPLLLPIAFALITLGLLVLTRVAENFTLRQTFSLAVSALAFAAVTASRDGLRWLKRFKYTWLAASFAILGATLLFGVNPSGAGARLWLRAGSFFLQPSELLRLLIIAFWAAYFAERQRMPPAARPPLRAVLIDTLPAIVMWLVAAGMLGSQQDFGAASLLVLTFAFMLYLATARKRLPLALIVAFLAAGIVGFLTSERVATRVRIWLDIDIDPQGRSFQVVQSLIAIASGGVFGQGLGLGQPGIVPAVHTDFPFVAIAEELGLIGALCMLALFALLCWRAWRITLRSPSPYVQLLTGGIAASLTVQVAVIIGGNMALLPLTGVTLPFISAGGSSLLVWMISVGLLIRLSADAESSGVRALGARVAQRHTAMLSVGIFAALGTAIVINMMPRAPGLVARRDNLRRVDDERRIARGSILSADGTVLASSVAAGAINGSPTFLRTYAITEASGAVGYLDERYGAGGLEAFSDAQLRGSRSGIEQLLHATQRGTPVTTTLDLDQQRAVLAQLNGSNGAGIVLDWRTGAIRALVSAPGFDANQLERDWEALSKDASAPLLNRVTQGLYQPGPLLAWLYNGDAQAFARDANDRFNLSRPAPFELENLVVPYPVTRAYSETIGQGALRVTPLRIALAVVERGGLAAPRPTLLAAEVEPASVPSGALQAVRFETRAQTGLNQDVLWRITVDERHVTVIAIETRARPR
jgi:cell division protein FtsW (lipid II flippase)